MPTSPQDCITDLMQKKQMLICCGSGGVGKTTTSAILALRAAQLGKKALVLTIDPARRLANSLGLEALGNSMKRIEPEHLAKSGIEVPGELWAMMLDCKRTFDELVRRYAPNEQACERILKNRYYQHISDAMTGSHEYMAMEKLYEIYESGEFDLIVLDTPPTHNALDFLEAPNKLINFLDDSVLRWFLKPYFMAGKLSLHALQAGSKVIFKVLEKITGYEVLHDISEFFMAFSEMYVGFKKRAEKVRDTLKGKETAFILITSPNPITVRECLFFHDQILENRLTLGGIIVNKVHPDLGEPDSPNLQTLESHLIHGLKLTDPSQKDLVQNLLDNFRDFQILGTIDREALETLSKRTKVPIQTMPYFDRDIYALGELRLMLETLFGRTPFHTASVEQTISN